MDSGVQLDTKSGRIWAKYPLKENWKHKRSPLVQVHNGDDKASKSDKKISFTCMCFQRSLAPDTIGPLASIDEQGNIEAFDFQTNSRWLVGRTGISGTGIAFGRAKRHELYVALSDTSIQCFHVERKVLIAKLPGHGKRTCVYRLSPHPVKNLLLSCSSTELVLWETQYFTKKRMLNSSEGLTMADARFTPIGDKIVAMFGDNSAMIWNSETFALEWKIDMKSSKPADLISKPMHSFVSVSHNEIYLALASLVQPSIYVWDMTTSSLVHEITVPSFEQDFIKSIQFIGNSERLLVQSRGGQVVIIDAEKGVLVTKNFDSVGKVSATNLSSDGEFFAAVPKSQKHLLQIFSLEAMLLPEDDIRPLSPVKEIPVVDMEEESRTPDLQPKESKIRQLPIAKATTTKMSLKQVEDTFELQDSVFKQSNLNRKKLSQFLHHFGEFPDKYRILIWKFLLQLPDNRSDFDALLAQGIHPSLRLFRDKYPMKSERVSRTMEKILSCLAYWSPVFENSEHLPSLIYPFVKSLQTDVLTCYEVILTVIVNWCQHFWEFHPNPSMQVLAVIEDLMALHEPKLLAHFKKHQISSQIYAWSSLRSLFSNIMTKQNWLVVLDHLFVSELDFMYFLSVAILWYFKAPLLRLTKQNDFVYFFNRVQPIQVSKLIQKTHHLRSQTPRELKPKLQAFTPLLKGHYPIFNRYPEHIVNYQKKLREKIRIEEEDYMRKRRIAEDVAKLTDELKREQSAWKNIEYGRNNMLQQWWNTILTEEEEHLDRKSKIDAINNERRIDAMRTLADAQEDFKMEQMIQNDIQSEILKRAEGKTKLQESKTEKAKSLEEKLRELETTWSERKARLSYSRSQFQKAEDERLNSFLKSR